jgi:uncharacterized protein (DUF1778 family)
MDAVSTKPDMKLVPLALRVPREMKFVIREKAAQSRETMEQWLLRTLCEVTDRPDLMTPPSEGDSETC